MVRVRLRSVNFPNMYIRHRNFVAEISPLRTMQDHEDATFHMAERSGERVTFRATNENLPNHYLRHYNFQVRLDRTDFSTQFARDATFIKIPVQHGIFAFRSFNFPDRYIRHKNFLVHVDPWDNAQRNDFLFVIDRSQPIDPNP